MPNEELILELERLRARVAELENCAKERESGFISLFNGMTDGFALHEIICDECGAPCDYRFLEVKTAFEWLTGLKRGEIIGRTVREVLPDIEPQWIERYGAVPLGGGSVWFESHAAGLKRDYGVFAYCPAPQQFAALFTEITERKQKEEETLNLLRAFRREDEKLTALVNSMEDEVWFADTQRRFTLVNSSAVRHFRLFGLEKGIDLASFIASLEVYRPDGTHRPMEESPALLALEGEVTRNQVEMVRIPATGELRYREVSSAPVRDANGTIIGSVSVVRDITERRRA